MVDASETVINARNSVLVGDANQDRGSFLKEVLVQDFLVDVVWVKTFDEVQGYVDEVDRYVYGTQAAAFWWKLVLIAEDLRRSYSDRRSVFPADFDHISRSTSIVKLGCLHSSNEPLDLTGVGFVPLYLYVPPPPFTTAHREMVFESIARKHELGLKPASLPPTVNLDINDPVLCEQIRGLSQTYDLLEGKKLLGYLIRNFDRFPCDTVSVSKLGQGASGATVFRFRPDSTGTDLVERVLKISPRSKEWKLRSEVEMHLKAKDSLGNKYQRHVPDLERVGSKDESSPRHIVSHGDWCAVCYDFLGGELFGRFIDLETAIVGSSDRVADLTEGTTFAFNRADRSETLAVRRRVLKTMLDWLYQNWYSKPNLWERRNRSLWSYQDGPDDKYITLPPYQLSGKSKRIILSFLDSRNSRLGIRFFENEWVECHRRVREFLELSDSELSATYSLDKEKSVILSPAHGDLNANNILLWLDQVHPFLIDFPFYQEAGHALQDFARLEVEIKFALMDNQEGSPIDELRALDRTHSQMPLWKRMEDHLLNADWQTSMKDKPKGCFTDNVEMSLEFVQLLRARAKEVQKQRRNAVDVPDFFDEYRPALLFHTLRAIGYESLPIFKRLLAVYSAAALLGQSRHV